MPDLAQEIAGASGIAGLAAALSEHAHVVASGSAGSSTNLLAGALAKKLARCVVLVLAHLDEADEAAEELAGDEGLEVVRLPGLEVMAGEAGVSAEVMAERLAAVRSVAGWAGGAARVVLCPVQALMQSVPRVDRLASLWRALERGESVAMGELVRWLGSAGYSRVDAAEEPGDFAVRGGILDVFPAGGSVTAVSGESAGVSSPVRLDFFGDQIERIAEIDAATMGSGRELARVEIVAAKGTEEDEGKGEGGVNFIELLPRSAIALIAETMEVTEQARGYFERVTHGAGVFGPPAVFKLLKERCGAIAEVNQFSAGSTSSGARVELGFGVLPGFSSEPIEAMRELVAMSREKRVIVCCQNPGELQRFQELLVEADDGAARGERGAIEARLAYLHRGFVFEEGDAAGRRARAGAIVPYHELLHRYQTRRRAVRLRGGRAMDTFLDIAPGDHVVHAEHGIARYLGLKTMKPPRHREVAGGTDPALVPKGLREVAAGREKVEAQEYLTLEFAGKAKLHVPASNIDLVQKYIGGFHGKPQLSTLGGQRWKSQKEKVAESVRDLAAEMLRVRAAREHMPGVRYPMDTAWMKEFEAEFPYEETEDQLAAMAEIKRDMQSERPMDRLVCGDVGFGKTELAIRAAFKAVEFGKQVAVLVPTTVLAEQHERTFRARFAGYPFRVESLSRFKTDKEANDVLAATRKGHVDVLIGTHRILSQDVHFADLGLVVVDEEQRFGVEHKERLLRLRMTVDVLTLSATPIPRTLHMSMLGLRDISSLTTAPLDRRAIVTEVIPYNERRIQQAIARELSREGQVYFVHNRVHDIVSVADDVRRLSPEGTRIVVGHGQMPPGELEEVMLQFMRGRAAGGADILVSTTIIESGIDIASANTMIINDADRFGLADLHQLRGRVGRSRHRAYCYLLLAADRPVKEVAQKRLKAIEQYSMLGAGFKIAMRDLEIRGAGNLLGAEQSGHIAAVGYEMYCQLLEGAVRELKNEKPAATASQTGIDIGISGTIPKAYIPSDQRRLEAYRRIATAATLEELKKVEVDLVAAYGEEPTPVRRLLDLAELRVLAAGLGVRTIGVRGADVLMRTETPDAVSARLGATSGADARVRQSANVMPMSSAAHVGSLVGLRASGGQESERKNPVPDGRAFANQTAGGRFRGDQTRPPAEGGGSAPSLDVRVLAPASGEKLHEVYVRVPEKYLEPETLLAVLRKRLGQI